MKVRDYMSTSVISANYSDGLRQTFYRMRERGIRHMPVLGAEGDLVGVISDRDLRRPDWVDQEENVAHYYVLDNTKKVEGAMTKPPITIGSDEPIAQALELILDRGFGALPVVGDDGALVGMLSAVDLLRAFKDSLAAN
jgi:acetoin utilization protein AcuB